MTDVITGELPGSTLDDRYEIEGLIGRGGMASVFRARDTELHRPVAIKVLRATDDTAGEQDRRRREARAIASITHPSLVVLFDAVIREDSSYLVMELVDGETLRQTMDGAPISTALAAAIAHDIAAGLHAVHAAGIVHRDIKPANILLAPDTLSAHGVRAKLSDFGIAHFVDSTRVTTTGQLIGTAAYISPEQARGQEPTAASDIYALGLTLLESVTGTPAYVGSAIEVVVARLSRDPDIPTWLGPEWTGLLRRMTSRSPEGRPTAAEVAAAAPTLPSLVAPTADIEETQAWQADETHARTRRLPVVGSSTAADDSAPTTVLGGADSSETRETRSIAGDRAPARTTLVRMPGFLSTRRGRLIVAAVVAAAVLIGAGALIIPGTSPAESTESPAPSLPALPAPLDTDMKNLLEQVTP